MAPARTPRRSPASDGTRRRLATASTVAVWLAIGALWALDRHGPHVGVRAEIFSAIVGAISWLSGALATAAEATAAYLATAVSWLGTHLASLMTNTGSMFSKVWEGAKIVYGDVVKPALQWLHDTYERIKGWMTDVFGPVLKWANRVRSELQSLYKRFVKPILSILDTSRAVLDILAKLHVPFAAALERTVTDIEQTITENYLRLLGEVNKVITTLNGFFTLDGLLQRFTLLRSIERDAYYISRVIVNSRSRELTDGEVTGLLQATSTATVPDLSASITANWNGEQNDVGASVDALAASFAGYWQSDNSGVPT